jgi:hypothetical protein
LATRAEIIATSFVNEYELGDFHGDPFALMRRYFDAFLYASRGTGPLLRCPTMGRWVKGERTIVYLIDRGRLENLEATSLEESAAVLIRRAALRVGTSAEAAFKGGDVEGAYVAAYDAYRMAAECLLVRQGLRATGGDGSHMTVEDAVSAQFGERIPAFAKPTFERFRRTRHSAQYFDPNAAPVTESDTSWAIAKASAVVAAVQVVLGESRLGRFAG